jgi:hypothetical protein
MPSEWWISSQMCPMTTYTLVIYIGAYNIIRIQVIMLWLPFSTQQDLKMLLSFSCKEIDRIVQSYSKIAKQGGNQGNHDYDYYEQILVYDCIMREKTQEDRTLTQTLSHCIVALSIICFDPLLRYDLLEGLRTMHFSEEEIQNIDELMDKLRKDGIVRKHNYSEKAASFVAGWGIQIYHELLHDDKPYTQLVDEIWIN